MPTPRIFIFLFLATGRRIQPHRRPPLPTPLRIRRTTLSRGFPLPSRNAVPLPTLPEILPLFRTQPIHVCHLRALMYIHLCTSPNRTYTHSHSHFPLMLVRNSAIYTSCIYIYIQERRKERGIRSLLPITVLDTVRDRDTAGGSIPATMETKQTSASFRYNLSARYFVRDFFLFERQRVSFDRES